VEAAAEEEKREKEAKILVLEEALQCWYLIIEKGGK